MTKHSLDSAHKEIVLQQHLVTQLVAGQGYEERSSDGYDRAISLDRELVLRFVKATQPDEWAKLVKITILDQGLYPAQIVTYEPDTRITSGPPSCS